MKKTTEIEAAVSSKDHTFSISKSRIAPNNIKDNKHVFYIVLLSIISCIFLYIAEQVASVSYIIKTITKIMFFTGIPVLYLKKTTKSYIRNSLNIRKVEPLTIKTGFFLGILSFAVIMIAYYILKGYIDLDLIANELQSKLKVTPSNFILVGLYITFGNSFLEEFFFRGFLFLKLYDLGYKKLAYIFSSLLFGAYHLSIFKTWFSPLLMGFALFGLISVSFIFNWMDIKTQNFINSWIVHILADSAIIIIGMRMFNII